MEVPHMNKISDKLTIASLPFCSVGLPGPAKLFPHDQVSQFMKKDKQTGKHIHIAIHGDFVRGTIP